MNNFIKELRKASVLIGSNKQSTIEYLNKWENSLVNPRKYYLAAYRYFRLYLDEELKLHKKYFQKERRGFGEEAFHTMWHLLYNKYKFEHFLEIGVYRGQVISLITLLAKINNNQIFACGISPFDKSGDSVSKYLDIDYIADINENFNAFKLKHPQLLNAYSTDGDAINLISSKMWDCIYIDGSHDYDIVLKDWEVCSRNVKVSGLIIFDDASLNTQFINPSFAFKGHPGPSKVADQVDEKNFKEVLRVGHNRVFQRLV